MNRLDRSKRIGRLQKRLSDLGVHAALIVLSRDVFYYTGTAQPCILVVTPTDFSLVVRRAADFVLNETWLDRGKIVNKGSYHEVSAILKEAGIKSGKLGLEMDVIPAELFLKIRKLFPALEPVNISEEIVTQRMEKDEEEIESIRSACRIMKAGQQRVTEVLSEGMTELELAAEVECAHRKAGHEGVLSMRNFDFYISRGPLSSGENLFRVSGFSNTITGVGVSPAIPAGPSLRKIRNGDLVIVDIPTCCRGYHSDETRTFVLGRASDAVKGLFRALKEISDRAISVLRDGVRIREVFDAAHSCADRLGVQTYFLGLNPRKGNFIGHGIGLDANEPPILFQGSDFPLGRNFVVTVEVHLTHPEHGAVKLEDVVLITKNGSELLSLTQRELFIV